MTAKYELIALVKQVRQAAGLSIAEVASTSKIDPGAISRFEAGKKFLAPAYFVRYIDACRITGSDRARAVKLYNQARRNNRID